MKKCRDFYEKCLRQHVDTSTHQQFSTISLHDWIGVVHKSTLWTIAGVVSANLENITEMFTSTCWHVNILRFTPYMHCRRELFGYQCFVMWSSPANLEHFERTGILSTSTSCHYGRQVWDTRRSFSRRSLSNERVIFTWFQNDIKNQITSHNLSSY